MIEKWESKDNVIDVYIGYFTNLSLKMSCGNSFNSISNRYTTKYNKIIFWNWLVPISKNSNKIISTEATIPRIEKQITKIFFML